VLADPNGGTASGAAIIPSSLSAANQSRSDARVAYFDSAISRANLHVVAKRTVTRLVFATSAGVTAPDIGRRPSARMKFVQGIEVANSFYVGRGPQRN